MIHGTFRPLYTVGRYSTGTYLARTLAIRELVVPLADRFGVDLVLNGHDHNYQRTYPLKDGAVTAKAQDPRFAMPGGTIYVVTGGGGRVLYSESRSADHTENRIFVKTFHAVELVIAPSRIDARAISGKGETIDSFSVEKGFLRGDADGDGSIGLPDVVMVLGYLFQDQPEPSCLDRHDANDDGSVDISDAVYLLVYLYGGGPGPPPPFPDAGGDPTPDDLPCS